jgi:hypothetical protein
MGKRCPAMAFSHVIYVDEAGDEGFGKLKGANADGQSNWLLLGAAIVDGVDDRKLPTWRDEILKRFPEKKQRDLHFRKLKHEQKVVVCQEIAPRNIRACVAFSHKVTIPGSKWAETFKRPSYLYNFMTRWLLERVTSYCFTDAPFRQGQKARIMVVFSKRRGTDYQAMHDYMLLMRDGREKMKPVRSIRWEVFDPADIAVEDHSKWAGLQLADAVTSAFFGAVEANGYGNREPRYAEILRPCVICDDGKIALNTGVIPVPSWKKCQAPKEVEDWFLTFGKKGE